MKIDVNVPDGVSGVWRVESFEVTEDAARFENIRAMFGSGRHIQPGKYKRLMRGRTVVMSNTPAEISDHLSFIFRAKEVDNVLINGLGLGVALTEILKSNTVKRVDVVEQSEDVIKLSGPTYTADPRVHIHHANALEFKPEKGVVYGAVWHDIWDGVCSDNLPDMKLLHRRYGKKAQWQGSWCRSMCEDQKRRDKRYSWR